MKRANTTEINREAMDKILDDVTTSKSYRIKALFDLGMECNDIAKCLGIRYNFAYNIISNYARINDIELTTSERGSKTAAVKALSAEGKTIAEISKATKTNYSQVWKIVNDMKKAGELKDKDMVEQKAPQPASSKVKAAQQKAGAVKVSHIDPKPVTKEEKDKAVAVNAIKG